MEDAAATTHQPRPQITGENEHPEAIEISENDQFILKNPTNSEANVEAFIPDFATVSAKDEREDDPKVDLDIHTNEHKKNIKGCLGSAESAENRNEEKQSVITMELQNTHSAEKHAQKDSPLGIANTDSPPEDVSQTANNDSHIAGVSQTSIGHMPRSNDHSKTTVAVEKSNMADEGVRHGFQPSFSPKEFSGSSDDLLIESNLELEEKKAEMAKMKEDFRMKEEGKGGTTTVDLDESKIQIFSKRLLSDDSTTEADTTTLDQKSSSHLDSTLATESEKTAENSEIKSNEKMMSSCSARELNSEKNTPAANSSRSEGVGVPLEINEIVRKTSETVKTLCENLNVLEGQIEQNAKKVKEVSSEEIKNLFVEQIAAANSEANQKMDNTGNDMFKCAEDHYLTPSIKDADNLYVQELSREKKKDSEMHSRLLYSDLNEMHQSDGEDKPTSSDERVQRNEQNKDKNSTAEIVEATFDQVQEALLGKEETLLTKHYEAVEAGPEYGSVQEPKRDECNLPVAITDEEQQLQFYQKGREIEVREVGMEFGPTQTTSNSETSNKGLLPQKSHPEVKNLETPLKELRHGATQMPTYDSQRNFTEGIDKPLLQKCEKEERKMAPQTEQGQEEFQTYHVETDEKANGVLPCLPEDQQHFRADSEVKKYDKNSVPHNETAVNLTLESQTSGEKLDILSECIVSIVERQAKTASDELKISLPLPKLERDTHISEDSSYRQKEQPNLPIEEKKKDEERFTAPSDNKKPQKEVIAQRRHSDLKENQLAVPPSETEGEDIKEILATSEPLTHVQEQSKKEEIANESVEQQMTDVIHPDSISLNSLQEPPPLKEEEHYEGKEDDPKVQEAPEDLLKKSQKEEADEKKGMNELREEIKPSENLMQTELSRHRNVPANSESCAATEEEQKLNKTSEGEEINEYGLGPVWREVFIPIFKGIWENVDLIIDDHQGLSQKSKEKTAPNTQATSADKEKPKITAEETEDQAKTRGIQQKVDTSVSVPYSQETADKLHESDQVSSDLHTEEIESVKYSVQKQSEANRKENVSVSEKCEHLEGPYPLTEGATLAEANVANKGVFPHTLNLSEEKKYCMQLPETSTGLQQMAVELLKEETADINKKELLSDDLEVHAMSIGEVEEKQNSELERPLYNERTCELMKDNNLVSSTEEIKEPKKHSSRETLAKESETEGQSNKGTIECDQSKVETRGKSSTEMANTIEKEGSEPKAEPEEEHKTENDPEATVTPEKAIHSAERAASVERNANEGIHEQYIKKKEEAEEGEQKKQHNRPHQRGRGNFRAFNNEDGYEPGQSSRAEDYYEQPREAYPKSKRRQRKSGRGRRGGQQPHQF